MQRICILALVGLPASGKTSFCKWLLSLQQLKFHIVSICYDDFLAYSTADTTTEINFKKERSEIFQILQRVVNASQTGTTIPYDVHSKLKSTGAASINAKDLLIICDDNNYYRSMRYKLYQFCKHNCLAFAQIYFECDAVVALTRNMERAASERIPKMVFQHMCERIEPPNRPHSGWETATLALNTSTTIALSEDIVIPFILNSFENVLSPTTTADSGQSQTCTTTAVHALDLLLRRRIKELLNMGSTTKIIKQTRANSLNVKRKEILDGFKQTKEQNLVVEDLNKFVQMLY